MNLLDCMGQPAVADTVWPPRGLKFLAPLVLYSTVDHTNSRESNYPVDPRCDLMIFSLFFFSSSSHISHGSVRMVSRRTRKYMYFCRTASINKL
jgi:hypothetical protein